ncbi:MAG: branched-chain-amino-acid transaminase [Elusimicrobia bacterium CG02_land_8_20_14_3_00_37_13]|nr:MAG: branched-chain-amino-acid transaminase [Elusimicrobia bacterium CG02_land_8_20_14_3_00_37_13]
MKIWLNGKFVDREKANISVFDHGLLYGDGVFEGIRAYDGRVFRLKEHLDRLYNSAKAILLKIPLSKEQMGKAVLSAVRKNKLHNAYIRLVVTRGPGDLGLDPRKCRVPSMFIIVDKIVLYSQEYYTNGLKIITAATRRNPPCAISPHIKSLNYLNNILAKIEAIKADVPEAIMLNEKKQVVECTGDNVFIIKNGKLISPPTSAGALPGITRNAVMELARRKLKIPAEERLFKMEQVYNADECFLTGTAAEVVPVVVVDGKKIGNGKPGRITRRLMEEFRKLTKSTGVPIY